MTGIFDLDTVFAKKIVTNRGISSSFDMAFPVSIRLIFLPLDTFCVKRGKMVFQNILFVSNLHGLLNPLNLNSAE